MPGRADGAARPGVTTSAPSNEARIRAADDENSARLGRPRDRSSSAIGWSPSTRVAPPEPAGDPSAEVVQVVRRRTPSAKE